MIYGVSRNNRSEIGYEPSSGEIFEHPKSVDKMIINYPPIYSNFKYGHSHNIIYTHSNQNSKFVFKPKFRENFRQTNQRGPKRIWVPKDKIIYVADVLSSHVKTPTMDSGKWRLSSHKGKKVYVPKSGT